MLHILCRTGPLFVKLLQFIGHELPPSISLTNLTRTVKSLYKFHDGWVIFRNIIFAPISEELIFRSILIPNLYISLICQRGSDGNNIPLFVARVSPIWFGIAHMHHLIERLREGQPFQSTILTTLIQLTYTSIFGYMSALLFMRTGNILASVWSHMICNAMGLPDLSFCDPSSSDWQLYPYRIPLLILHAAGLILFSFLLFPLTENFSHTSVFWNSDILRNDCFCPSL